MKNIRHGDISFHIVDKLPENLKKVEHNGIFVIAEGEITGHQHRLKGKFELMQDAQGNYYIQTEQAEIEHYNSLTKEKAEHNTLPIERGIYVVKQERSYNPFLKAIERTAD